MAEKEKGCANCGTQADDSAREGVCGDCGVPFAEKKTCGHCGYSKFGSFMNDMCPDCGFSYWKCGQCSRIVAAQKPPETCPACNEKCDFKNVTCYTPDCGGPGNIDPQL